MVGLGTHVKPAHGAAAAAPRQEFPLPPQVGRCPRNSGGGNNDNMGRPAVYLGKGGGVGGGGGQ